MGISAVSYASRIRPSSPHNGAVALNVLMYLYEPGTVQAQYTRGPLKIATWAHLTNAHIFPGPAIVSALSLAAKATLKTLTQYVSTEITAGPSGPASEDEDSDENDDDDDDENADSEDYSSTDNREYVLLKSEGKKPEKAEKPEGKQGAMASAFSGRKNSVVTATTTIFQTIEEKRGMPGLKKSESVDATEECQSREEALEALGDPPLSRGLLLLAEMSSEGHLMTPEYTSACVAMAREHPDFVIGFISQRALNSRKGDNFLSFTPGVSLPPEGEGEARMGDGLGQQYRTPGVVIAKEGCDVVIVGRGILGAQDRRREAEKYRREAWRAYEGRIKGRR